MRKIIKIDDGKCDGCGLCAEACHEGAIRIVDGKAKLTSDSYCDGLGDCIGECPRGAISFETREAAPYDEAAVKERMARKAEALASDGPLLCGCHGSMARRLKTAPANPGHEAKEACRGQESELRNWPVQIQLVPVQAPYLEGAALLIAADCTAFAYPNFHRELLPCKVCLIGCPKLDDAASYAEKLARLISLNKTPQIDVVYMEVPCCGGLVKLVEEAITGSGESVTLNLMKLSLDGKIIETRKIFAR